MHFLIVAGLAESPALPGFLPRLFAALATAGFLLYLFPLGVKAVIRLSPNTCLLYTSPSPRDRQKSRMPSSA